MKALTIWQPWASFVIKGAKQYETRGWSTTYRGLLAIHAGVKRMAKYDLEDDSDLLKSIGITHPSHVPYGAVLGIARLVDVVKTEPFYNDPVFAKSQECHLGDWYPGRFGWKLEIVEDFPVPYSVRGAQGLWEWNDPLRHLV